jgi:hypothetical protein
LALLTANVWPALCNRQPFFYGDTSAYVRGADAAFTRFLHRPSAWLLDDSGSLVTSMADKIVLSGRSIYYGTLLYIGALAGRLWPVVFVQSAVVLIAIALTLRLLALFTWARLAFVSLALAAVTPMPFFVSFLMPDIFAAITILSIANLLIGAARQPFWTTVLWTAFLTAALLFHISNILIALALIAVFAFALLLFRIRPWRTGLSAVLCSLAIAFAGEAAFNSGVKKIVGEPPLRPPILMARMIADGPGYRYLRASCPSSGFTACRFLNRLPLHPDQFVWGENPASGVFSVASPDTKRALSNEQYRFAWNVFRFEPLASLADFLRDAALQLTDIGYDEFNYDPASPAFWRTHLPSSYYDAILRTPASYRRFPEKVLSAIAIASTCLSIVVLVYLLCRRKEALARNRVLMLVGFICLGVVVNAAVCALSATHDRYQTRVIWLIPFAAFLLYLEPYPSRLKRRPSVAPPPPT